MLLADEENIDYRVYKYLLGPTLHEIIRETLCSR